MLGRYLAMSGNSRADTEQQLVVVWSIVTADGTDRTYSDSLRVNCLEPLLGGMQAISVKTSGAISHVSSLLG